ncbi:MAG: Type 4 prepilin-like protein leader peptide-processing enzyme [Parcubacteria group bacterium GW2011_GWA2_46_7]|nr:MAG: Type 4 prepilin-like protein leader peptide-processing enzyme [Parcubacteria group bacterium GW2011_GWA2_46_7]
MQAILYSLSFLFGSAIGSFINVVVYRLRPEVSIENINGRSHCDSCKKTLRWYELIPILSFILQKGKCRRCRKIIPAQYCCIEICTGAVFALLAWRLLRIFPMVYGTSSWWWGVGLIGLWWVIATVLMAVSSYDFSYYLIPDIFLYALIGFGVVINGYYVLLVRYVPAFPSKGIVFSDTFGYFMGRNEFSLLSVVWGVLFCVGVIGVAYVLSRGKAMGFGDVLLAVWLGLVLGWPDSLVGILLGFVSGTIVSLILIVFGKKTMKDIVPFGPFLVFGTFLAVLFSDTMVQGYFSLFSMLFRM